MLIAMPAAAHSIATRTELCSAIAPHVTLPRARPPWNVIRYVPSARAYTQPGTESCTLTFSVDMLAVHAYPAPSSVGIRIHGSCTSAITRKTTT